MVTTTPAGATPGISVITPIYNRPELIPALLATLVAQSVEDWELILVDDASSTDIGAALAAAPGGDDPRVRFVRLEENAGPGGARNAGIDAARGRFVAFLDSDDAWDPGKLAAQRDALLATADPDRAFCVCKTEVRYGGGQVTERPERAIGSDESGAHYLYTANMFAQCSSFFCGAALLQGPPAIRFEARLRQYEDHLFYMALVDAATDVVLLPDALSRWENDDRDDRMGARDDLEKGRRFIEIASEAGLMSPSEALAFELRCLSGELLHQNRGAALRLALRGARDKALPREAWLKVLLAGVIGPNNYKRLREARR